MKVLDLFAGHGGWGAPWLESKGAYEVLSLDIDPRFGTDIVADVLEWDPQSLPWRPDVVLASPPCEAFSVASIGHHWAGGKKAYVPRTEHARVSQEIVTRTVGIILELGPRLWVIENPRGVLRNLGLIPVEPTTIWACHFGASWAKPTDLWHNIPTFEDRGLCHNQRPEHPADCCCRDHEKASRGARTGIQGVEDAALRAVIPYGLANAVKWAAVRYFDDVRRAA